MSEMDKIVKVGVELNVTPSSDKNIEQSIIKMNKQYEKSQMPDRARQAHESNIVASEQDMRKAAQGFKRYADMERKHMREKRLELLEIRKIKKTLNKMDKQTIAHLKKEISLHKEKVREAEYFEKQINSRLPSQTPTKKSNRMGFGVMKGALGSSMNLALGMVGGISATMGVIGHIAQYNADKGMQIRSARANLLHETINAGNRETANGRGSQYFFWHQQREAANKKALEQQAKSEKADKYKLLGKIGGGVAALGFGIMTGGVGFGVMGALAAGASIMGSKKDVALLDKWRPGGDDRMYKSIKAQEFVQHRRQELAASKEFNPVKERAEKFYFSRAKGMLNLQRQLGMGDTDLFSGEGSLLGQNAKLGFSDKTTMSNMNSIMQAGGSSEMARGVGYASKLQRDMGMTNATSVLAKLSGTGMSGQESFEKTKKLMAEAVKDGVDVSKMTLETRKVAEGMANIIYQSGGSSVSARIFAAGSGGFTQREIQASGEAKGAFDKITGGRDGLQKRIRWSYMLNDKNKKNFKGLSSDELNQLVQTDTNDLSSKNFLVQRLMDENNISAKEAMKLMKGVQMSSVDFSEDAKKARLNYSKLTKGMTSSQVSTELNYHLSDQDLSKMTPQQIQEAKARDQKARELRKAEGAMVSIQGSRHGMKLTTTGFKAIGSDLNAFSNDNLLFNDATDEETAAAQKASGKSKGSTGNKLERGEAQGTLLNVNSMAAAKGLKLFETAVGITVENIHKSASALDEVAAKIKDTNKIMDKNNQDLREKSEVVQRLSHWGHK